MNCQFSSLVLKYNRLDNHNVVHVKWHFQSGFELQKKVGQPFSQIVLSLEMQLTLSGANIVYM